MPKITAMKFSPTPPYPWRRQKNGTFSSSDKAPATVKLTLPSDMQSSTQPWMKRIKFICKPPPPPRKPPIEPIPLTWELKRLNRTLCCKEDLMHTPQLGTPPARIQHDVDSLNKRKSFTWFLYNPEWSAKKVLAARASSAFIDKQNWLWGKVDKCGNDREALKQALYVDIEWARKEMERRNAEFYEEEKVLKQVRGTEGRCGEMSCK